MLKRQQLDHRQQSPSGQGTAGEGGQGHLPEGREQGIHNISRQSASPNCQALAVAACVAAVTDRQTDRQAL